MAKRHHLKSVETADGTIWLTLVCEDPLNFFIEQYNDAKISFLKERLKIIRSNELGRHEINGVPLVKLVERELKQILGAHSG